MGKGVTMNETRIIYNPGKAVVQMLRRRMTQETRTALDEVKFNAVGLVQTSVAGVMYYADRACKVSNVYPVELHGSCPQHITTLAFFGETTAVETAMKAILQEEQAKKKR